jgi:hypothetical protein
MTHIQNSLISIKSFGDLNLVIYYYYSGTFRRTGNTPTKGAASSLSVIPAKAGIQWDFKPYRHPGFPFSRE